MAVAVARRRVAIGGGGADRSGGMRRWRGTFGYVREKVAWRPSAGNKDPLKVQYFLKYLFTVLRDKLFSHIISLLI